MAGDVGDPAFMDIHTLDGQPFLDESCPLPLDRPFTAVEARAEGVSKHLLTWMVKQGFVRQPIKGVYVAAQVHDSTALRCQSLKLVVPDDCVICDRHAAWLHGAPMALAPNEDVQLRSISVFRPSGHGRLRNDLADSGERNLIRSDITEVNGLAVTTLLRTACDLGRVRFDDPALSGIDCLLALGLNHDELLAEVARFRRMRWVTTLRRMAPLGDGRAGSPGESALRLRWIAAGLPRPRPQLEVWRDGILIARLDLASEDLRFAAEYDGAEWHSSPEQREHDARRRSAVADEDWIVKPLVASNVYGRKQDAEQLLREGAVEARSRFGRLPETRRSRSSRRV